MARKKKDITAESIPGESKVDKIQTDLVVGSQLTQVKENPYYGKRIKIDDEEAVIKSIEDEVNVIEAERSKMGLVRTWDENEEQYYGVVKPKAFPFNNASNLHVHITSMSVDIALTKTKAQIYVSPFMLLQPYPGQIGTNLFQKILRKQGYLDTTLYDGVKIRETQSPIIKDAYIHGTGIGKLIHWREVEPQVVTMNVYGGGDGPEERDEELRKFETDFEKAKGTKEYKEYHESIQAGIPTEVWIKTDELLYAGPKLFHVDLRNLYIRPTIPDLNRHRVIQERQHLNYMDLVANVKGGFFRKDLLSDVIDKVEDYYDQSYTIKENICYYDYDKTGIPQRCVITYIDNANMQGKRIVKAITYPYIHRRPYYNLWRIEKDPKSPYGKPGFCKKLKFANAALDSLWNQTVDAGTMRNAPVLKAVRKTGWDPATATGSWGPASIFWCENSTNEVEAFQLPMYPAGEMLQYISWLVRLCEWQTGVSAYMTGQESPSDPSAPMGKAYMLLKEANLRINDYIQSLHDDNVNMYSQMDSLMYQYAKGDVLQYYVQRGETLELEKINRKDLGIKVQYRPQMSDITINEELQRRMDLEFATWLLQRPEIAGNPQAVGVIDDILIRGRGGIWERKVSELIPPTKSPEPMKAKFEDIMKGVGGEISGITQELAAQQAMQDMGGSLQDETGGWPMM